MGGDSSSTLRLPHLLRPSALGFSQQCMNMVGKLVECERFSQHRSAWLQDGFSQYMRLRVTDPRVSAVRERVQMQLDPEVDQAYPQRWLGRVQVTTTDGRVLSGAIDEPKGDPGNTLSRAELEEKFSRLVSFSSALSPGEASLVIQRVWSLGTGTDISRLIEVNDI